MTDNEKLRVRVHTKINHLVFVPDTNPEGIVVYSECPKCGGPLRKMQDSGPPVRGKFGRTWIGDPYWFCLEGFLDGVEKSERFLAGRACDWMEEREAPLGDLE